MSNNYVKACLTLIVLLLTVIAMRPIFSPTVAEAQASLSGVQISAQGADAFLLLDSKSGRFYLYDYYRGSATYLGRLTEIGKPLTK
jgi:hypothetical protein